MTELWLESEAFPQKGTRVNSLVSRLDSLSELNHNLYSPTVDEYKITKKCTKKEKKEKKTYTHNSPAVPTYCINVEIIIMQKYLFI